MHRVTGAQEHRCETRRNRRHKHIPEGRTVRAACVQKVHRCCARQALWTSMLCVHAEIPHVFSRHTHTHAQEHAHTQEHTHRNTHRNIHRRTHTHRNTHRRTNVHTHACAVNRWLSSQQALKHFRTIQRVSLRLLRLGLVQALH